MGSIFVSINTDLHTEMWRIYNISVRRQISAHTRTCMQCTCMNMYALGRFPDNYNPA